MKTKSPKAMVSLDWIRTLSELGFLSGEKNEKGIPLVKRYKVNWRIQ